MSVDGDTPAIAGGAPVFPRERAVVFGAPVIGEPEIAAVADCLRSRWIGSGPRVREFEREFAAYKQAPYAVAVSSGTAALHVAMVALGIGPGDEVIAPTMTFFSAVHAIVHAGATPVLADCDPRTAVVTAERIERQVTARTKAVMVVHLYGRCCDMGPILAMARKRNLRVIEDCAHALEASYYGRPSGLMGDIGCFSFYANKNLTTANGGMAVMSDRRLFRRFQLLAAGGLLGTAWERASRRQSAYRVVAAGFKYDMTDIEAALGLAQLPEVEPRWKSREENWGRYSSELADLPLLLPPPVDPGTRHAYHLFTALLAPERLSLSRKALIRALREENIGAGVHYVPVHSQPYYRRRFGFCAADFPGASAVGERTISLPLTAAMTCEDVAGVCAALRRILRYYSAGGSGGRAEPVAADRAEGATYA